MWMSSSASSNSKPRPPIRSPHALQPGVDLLELVVVEDAELAQAAGVRLRLVDVVGRQPPIELDRAVEAPEAGVGVFAEAGHEGIRLGPSVSARASQTRATWALGHRREEGQRQRARRSVFGDRELALAIAQLAQVGEEVDAGQVGLGGDAPLGERGDRWRRGRTRAASRTSRRTSCGALLRARRVGRVDGPRARRSPSA